MTTHNLKIEPAHFAAVVSGDKNFEVRLNDRGYQKGDILVLQEYDPALARVLERRGYTGKHFSRRIVYVHSGLGMADAYVVLGLGDVE